MGGASSSPLRRARLVLGDILHGGHWQEDVPIRARRRAAVQSQSASLRPNCYSRVLAVVAIWTLPRKTCATPILPAWRAVACRRVSRFKDYTVFDYFDCFDLQN